MSKEFLKQVFSGQKKLLLMSQIRPINVPAYQELSVKNLFDSVMLDEEAKIHFPDDKNKDSFGDKAYFFTVLNSLNP